jgi:hypothetical protein
LNKGVVFLHEQELLVTGNHWNIIVNTDVKWFRNTVNMLNLVWKQLERYEAEVTSQKADLVSWQELSRVSDITMELDREIKNVDKLLPVNPTSILRKRRGLINLGGQVLKFLFGTATNSEVQELQSVVSNYENQKQDIIHAVKSQLTLLQTVDKETKQNTVDLLNVARTLRQVVFEVVYLNRTISSIIDKTRIAFEVQKNISRTMRELEFTALRLQQELMQLHEGIDISSSGRLSSVLVPPNNLSGLLQQFALKLPRDVCLLAGTDLDNMYVYYDVARVQAYATLGSIRLVVRIPLRGTDRVMTLYRVESLPTYSSLLN